MDKVPEAMDLTDGVWQLSAEDWRPKYTYGTTGEAGSQTIRHRILLELDGLKSWPDIPELETASGVGTFSTDFDLPETWDDTYGAYIELGQVVDSFKMWVNGREVKVNQINPVADISSCLAAGKNRIKVRVSTTLNNTLSTLNEDVADRGIIQEYGLAGPVMVHPYRIMSLGE